VNSKLHIPLVGLVALTATFAFAQDSKKPAAAPAAKAGAAQDHGGMQLPPGWTEADMAACMAAMTPGPQHKHLAKAVGTWTGKSKMWMSEGAEAFASECSSSCESLMDGRFTAVEVQSVTPMGPFSGYGIYGFDNVSQKFQSTWIDNCGTGLASGTGELSPDGKTMTWVYTYNCPLNKKPTTMRQVETWTGDNALTMEMYAPDPKTGKEYKVLEVAYTRKGGAAAPASSGR
jgi:hypothetical protein